MGAFAFFATHGEQGGGAVGGSLPVESHAIEEGGKMVEIVLGVFLQRMVVASGTTDARAHEGLRDGIRRFALRGTLLADQIHVVANFRVLDGIAARCQDVAHQGVPGSVGGHLIPQPSVEGADILCTADVMIAFLPVLEQIRELECPVIGKLGALEQGVGQSSPLAG